MNRLILGLLVSFLLGACLPIPGLFYIGLLDSHDQQIFREAASIEGVEIVEEIDSLTWIVERRAPSGAWEDKEGWTAVLRIFLADASHLWSCDPGGQDQRLFVVMRHEIGHSQGKTDSDISTTIMHSSIPCWPID